MPSPEPTASHENATSATVSPVETVSPSIYENGAVPTLVPRDLIVIGASAGGVEALIALVKNLPEDLPASVFVVLHIPRHGASVLPAILTRHGNLPARAPEGDEPIESGVIYVAPADKHLVLENGRVRLTRGPSENGHRPAIDPLFRSAAKMGGARVIGVVLSGMLDDGTAGLSVVKRHGGTSVIQNPDDALFSGMPLSAQMNVAIDYSVPIRDMGALLAQLVAAPVAAQPQPSSAIPSNGSDDTEEMLFVDDAAFDTASPSPQTVEAAALQQEVGAALMVPASLNRETPPGATPSVYACPECAGVLWEVNNETLIRFRCRTGHAYSADSLLAAQSDALEAALWTALRALEESASLARRLHERAKLRGHHLAEARFAEQARESDERAQTISHVLRTGHAHATESTQPGDAITPADTAVTGSHSA